MPKYNAGVPEDEWNRLQNLPFKALTPADIPAEEWKAGYDEYQLRSDGVILSKRVGEVGWLDGKGGVSWLK